MCVCVCVHAQVCVYMCVCVRVCVCVCVFTCVIAYVIACVYQCFFQGFGKTLISCHPQIWLSEKLGSHVFFLLLPQPAGRPAASRHMVYVSELYVQRKYKVRLKSYGGLQNRHSN